MTTFSGCQINPKVPLIWIVVLLHEWTLIFTRGKPDHSSDLKGRRYGTGLLTYLTRFKASSVHTHPLRISRFILFHRISGQGYKLHVTSHCGDIEQNSSMEGGMDRRKEKMKGGTRMSQ